MIVIDGKKHAQVGAIIENRRSSGLGKILGPRIAQRAREGAVRIAGDSADGIEIMDRMNGDLDALHSN